MMELGPRRRAVAALVHLLDKTEGGYFLGQRTPFRAHEQTSAISRTVNPNPPTMHIIILSRSVQFIAVPRWEFPEDSRLAHVVNGRSSF